LRWRWPRGEEFLRQNQTLGFFFPDLILRRSAPLRLSGDLTKGPLDRLADQVGHPATERLREALAQSLAQIGQILLQTMELFG
jgi:hypothetical protein